MNLVLFANNELIDGHRLRLRDRRFEHIRDTLGARPGDCLRVGEIDGLMGIGTVCSIDDRRVELDIGLEDAPPPKLPLTVILALPRPKMMRRIFRSVAELGVGELHVINSYRVEKSYWQSPALDEQSIARHLIDGLQQARDTVLPKVSFHRLFKPFVEDQLPAIAGDGARFIAHPDTGRACPLGFNRAATLAIGAEGGFTAYEVEKFIAAGFEGIHLGARILRVENALTALAGKLYSP